MSNLGFVPFPSSGSLVVDGSGTALPLAANSIFAGTLTADRLRAQPAVTAMARQLQQGRRASVRFLRTVDGVQRQATVDFDLRGGRDALARADSACR